jgi:hypothetical protein
LEVLVWLLSCLLNGVGGPLAGTEGCTLVVLTSGEREAREKQEKGVLMFWNLSVP